VAAEQLSLLDWTPPQAALAECGRSRPAIARAMSEYLGETVSPAMLDAYASPGRDSHRIGAARLLALVHATGDRRLLQLLAEPFGWAVVEARHLALIEAALLREQEDELRRRREALLRRARG
jgi:hypothetical protein